MKKILSILIMLVALVPFGVFGQTFYIPGVNIAVVTEDNAALSFEIVFDNNLLPFLSELRDLEFDVTITDNAPAIANWSMPNFTGNCLNFTYTGHGGVYHFDKSFKYRGCDVVIIDQTGIDTRIVNVVTPGTPPISGPTGGGVIGTDYGYTVNIFNIKARYMTNSGNISPWYNIAPSSGSYSTLTGGNGNGDSRLAVESTFSSDLEFDLYPNPTSGIFTINNLENAKSVSIYNTVGQLVENVLFDSSELSKIIDLRNYSEGLYNVIITDKEGNQSNKKLILN